jgi:hypothetical protein
MLTPLCGTAQVTTGRGFASDSLAPMVIPSRMAHPKI